MRGRPRISGRFETRGELVKEVLWRWKETLSAIADIARACRTSEGTVDNIITNKYKEF